MDYFNTEDVDTTTPFDADFSEDRITKSFKGKNIFITGSSGFLGKILLEKILRSFDVDKIYLLFRSKKGVSPEQRIINLLKENLFEKARLVLGKDLFSKIVIINGDCRLPRLGISDEDIERISADTNYVFHVAAALKMDETIRAAYVSNVQGTDEILKMVSKMPNIKAFIYVSTAYSQTCFNVDEQFYQVHYQQEDLLKILEKVPDEILEVLSPKILRGSPNTYAMTKGIAEDVVHSYEDRVPLAIVRPSIVVGCVEEPLAGWIGSINGAIGVLTAASLGVMKVWGGEHRLNVDIVPVDYLINMTLAAAWKTAQSTPQKRLQHQDPVYNYVCTPKAPTTWGEYMKFNEDSFWEDKLHLNKTVMPYDFRLQPSWAAYRLQVVLFHLLPGTIIDALLKLFKRRPKLVKVYRKLHTLNSKLFFYCTHEWEFSQVNVDRLWSEMNKEEKESFPFDMTRFNWKDFCVTSVRGLKVYLLKEPMFSKKENEKMIWMHRSYALIKYSTIIFLLHQIYYFLKGYVILLFVFIFFG